MRKLLFIGLGILGLVAAAGAPALAQSHPFESSVLEVAADQGVIYQRYYTPTKSEINPNCTGACGSAGANCEPFGTPSQNYCRLSFNATRKGYRGYTENLFNFGAANGTTFYSVFDFEKNTGAGNHQGFYAWTSGPISEGDTDSWFALDCTGTIVAGCLGNGNGANARAETGGVPASSGGPAIANIGGLSPIPVPKAAAGSSGDSFNLSWNAISSVGRAGGVAPAGYEVWGARSANCASAATAGQFEFVKLVAGTSTTVNLSEVPGTGSAVTFALKIRYPNALGGTIVATRFLSANSQCFLGSGLSANVYELSAKYAGKTNVEVGWKTSLEDGVRGFYVSRATTQNGPFTRVSELISAKGEASAYSYIDTIQVPAGTVKATGLWYKVETIDIDDNAVEYGPVKAQLPGPSGNAVIKQRTAKPQR